MARPTLRKTDFANIDARVRCPTEDCWGELLLMPTGAADEEGIPAFLERTMCPLCGGVFEIEQDMSDRDLFLKVSHMRANPMEGLDDA
ncbi:MAG: hypothetical protein U0237_13020 [Thermoleophilia bacterium]